MGLDMYLKAKRKSQNKIAAAANAGTKLTGVCNGLFPIAPADNGCDEIGYWRKAYDQRELIFDIVDDGYADFRKYINCLDMLITKDEIDMIIEGAKIEVADIEEAYKDWGKSVCPDFERFADWRSVSFTSHNYRKWKDTIRFFTKAKKFYAKYPDAEVYYEEWY